MWELIKAGTFYIISSPFFIRKNTYKYFHNRNEFNTAKREESFSWKDYYFWKYNKELYISELEKLVYLKRMYQLQIYKIKILFFYKYYIILSRIYYLI
jgi:hypothetical protein